MRKQLLNRYPILFRYLVSIQLSNISARVALSAYWSINEALYRCGVNRLGDSGVNRLGDTSAFIKPTVQLLLTRRGKIRMDGFGIVFEFYTAPL